MAEEAVSVNLRILSPSTEVEGGVHLADLPATTTIGELRQRIQDAAPSRPAIDRMRLIYRGRVVANDNDTLEILFGSDNVSELSPKARIVLIASSSASPRTRAYTSSYASSLLLRLLPRQLRVQLLHRQTLCSRLKARPRTPSKQTRSEHCQSLDQTHSHKFNNITTITRILTPIIITTISNHPRLPLVFRRTSSKRLRTRS